MTKKLSIGLIFGGRSGEHDASLASAACVMAHLNQDKFEVVPIGISQDGTWLSGTSPADFLLQAAHQPTVIEAEPVALSSRVHDSSPAPTMAAQPGAPLMAGQRVDVVFPVLHGTYGEDGALQGLLEMVNLPYVGCGVLGGALGMDKEKTKLIFQAVGLPVVDFQVFHRHEWEHDPHHVLDAVERRFASPYFVKPANGGSSLGISKVRSRSQLQLALQLAFRYDHKVLIETAVDCREIACAVLGNHDPQASVVGEVIIESSYDFYDYQAKYLDRRSHTVIPAELPPDLTEQVRQQSLQAFRALDLTGLARIDFFLDKETGRLYLNEVNTLPSFTQDCMYPKLCAASGLSYPQLLERLIELAVESHADHQRNHPLKNCDDSLRLKPRTSQARA